MDDKNMSVSIPHDTERDFFADIYRQYQNSEYIKELHVKYTVRPYYVKHKYTKLTALITSYLFNIFSGISACVLVYLFALSVTGLKVVAIITSLLFLALFEVSKRLIAVHFFREKISEKRFNPGWFFPLLILTGISMFLSYGGGKQVVHITETPPTVASPNPKIARLDNRIATLTEQIEKARQAKYYNGTTTKESRQTIVVLTQQTANLESEKTALEQADRMEATELKNTWQTGYKAKLFWFPIGTLIFEIWFLFSIWYLEYFDWRSWVEFDSVQRVYEANTDSTHDVYTQKSQAMPLISEKNEFDIDYLKSRIATAKYRLKNGIGREETNRKNLEKFMKLST